MPLYTATSIVLRRMNFGETDRIVTLYTRERGKIGCIAKGARKPVSRLSGSTELLTYGRFQLAEGRTLDIITQVDVKNSFPKIHSDLPKIAHSTYISEVVGRLIEEREPSCEVFDLLLSSLYLTERLSDPERVTHMFELQMMSLLGYEPGLDSCLRCGSADLSDAFFFSPSMGGLVCRDCGPIPGDAIQVLPETVATMRRLLVCDAAELEHLEIPSEVMEEISRAMRWYVRYRSDRDFKSMEFLQSIRGV